MFKKNNTKKKKNPQQQGSPIDNKTVYTWIAVKKCDLFGTGPKRLFPFTSSSIINLLVVHINDGTFPLTYGSEIFTEGGL